MLPGCHAVELPRHWEPWETEAEEEGGMVELQTVASSSRINHQEFVSSGELAVAASLSFPNPSFILPIPFV